MISPVYIYYLTENKKNGVERHAIILVRMRGFSHRSFSKFEVFCQEAVVFIPARDTGKYSYQAS
jgi:hypothetical protein